MWHCCIYKKRNVRLSSDVPFFVYVSYCKNAIVYQAYRSPPYGGGVGGRAFPLIVYVSYSNNAIVYPAYHSPPCGGGARGWGFLGLFYLLPTEIGRHLAPLAGLPLHQIVLYLMRAEPCLGASDYLVEGFGLRCALQFGLALSLLNPQYCVVRVGIDGLARNALAVE